MEINELFSSEAFLISLEYLKQQVREEEGKNSDSNIFLSTSKLALAHIEEILGMSKNELLKAADDELLAFSGQLMGVQNLLSGGNSRCQDEFIFARCAEFYWSVTLLKIQEVCEKKRK